MTDIKEVIEAALKNRTVSLAKAINDSNALLSRLKPNRTPEQEAEYRRQSEVIRRAEAEAALAKILASPDPVETLAAMLEEATEAWY